MHNINDKKISAVVVTYNRKELLAQCISALLKQTHHLSRIYIVDNASTDGTQRYLQETGCLGNENVSYIKLDNNTGGAGGFCTGMKVAYDDGSDWIWIMDDDAEPSQDALKALLNPVIDGFVRERDCLTSLLVTSQGDVSYEHRGVIKLDGFVSNIVRPLKPSDIRPGIPTLIHHSSFVGLLLPRDIVSDIGYPDRRFFIHYDDVDYSIRLGLAGYKIYLIPNSIIVHKEGRFTVSDKKKTHLFMVSSTRRVSIYKSWIKYYSIRNLIYLCRKYQTNRAVFCLETLIRFVRIVGGIMLYDDRKLERATLVVRAIYDGLYGNLGKNIDPVEWRKKVY
jgi:GT2 family glycosyltransferase